MTGASPWAGRRVVLVHDWLTGQRGGERVLDALCELFPEAELLTLVHLRGSVSPRIEQRRIRRSWVQFLPRAATRYREYLLLFPTAIEQFDLDEADLVVSTSHCAAKSVVKTGRAVHVCYCHSPMRYAWDQFGEYFGAPRVGRAANAVLRHAMAHMARWDATTAHRVDRFVANSSYVAGRIRRYYNRDADVLHPPVDTTFFTPGPIGPDAGVLAVSALVPYKRLDLAIGAAARVGRPLTIIGTGPDEARLRAMAGPTVTFRGRITDEELRDAYRRASAVLLPGEEDFGLVPVEAMACGRPVVALARGGACETVVDGVTGALVDASTSEAFADGLDRVLSTPPDQTALRQRALEFSPEHFEAAFRALIGAALSADPHAATL
jgi:glycosyltransferase involved in cell wall biosynthesis